MLYLHGFELGPGFNWDTVYADNYNVRRREVDERFPLYACDA